MYRVVAGHCVRESVCGRVFVHMIRCVLHRVAYAPCWEEVEVCRGVAGQCVRDSLSGRVFVHMIRCVCGQRWVVCVCMRRGGVCGT